MAQTPTSRFADEVPYRMLVEDGVLYLRNGSLLAAWQYFGPDMDSNAGEHLQALSARVNQVLCRLGTGWMLHCDVIRSVVEDYPDVGAFPDPVTKLIDEERRQDFSGQGEHYASEYFFALTKRPQSTAEKAISGWMWEGAEGATDAMRVVSLFLNELVNVEQGLASSVSLRRLRLDPQTGCDDLLRYVHRAVTGIDHPIKLPANPSDIQDVVATMDFLGGHEPILDAYVDEDGRWQGRHVRVIAIDGFPLNGVPGILRALDMLPMEYRWSTRAEFLDQQQGKGSITEAKNKWKGKIFGFMDSFVRPVATGDTNDDAASMKTDAQAALAEAEAGDVRYLRYSAKLVLIDADLDQIQNSVALAMQVIRDNGFACRVERVNAVKALLGTFPGDDSDKRRFMIHTLNLADLLPLTSIWGGSRECPSPKMPPHSPALLYASTAGAATFHLNLHVGEVGHTLMTGPTGCGKSTSLGLIAAQWFRYPDAKVVCFDKGHSAYVLTKACGGTFYEPGKEDGSGIALQPLAHLETEVDIAWAADYVETLCVMQGAIVGPRERSLLSDAVKLLRTSQGRSLSDLWVNVQDLALKEALQPYKRGNPLGNLIDHEEQEVDDESRFVTFELGSLMQMGEMAVSAVLPCLFRWVARRVENGAGEPTLVLLDELWLWLRHPRFRAVIEGWLRTLRKHNGAVVMSTPSLADVLDSPIAASVIANCPTKLLLPDAAAEMPVLRKYYSDLGLGDREIAMIASAQPKRDCYVVSPDGRRMISLVMHGVALSFCGVNSREERMQVDRLIDECAAEGRVWQAEWLRRRGLGDWAQYLEEEQLCQMATA